MIAGGPHQRQGVLREARSAVSRPGMEELAADPAVETDAAGDFLHVRADFLAQIGDFIDKRDLGGQKRIRRVFCQLRRLDLGEQDRRFHQEKRTVKLLQNFRGTVGIRADDHAVGTHEILDCRAFTEEFGVRGHVEFACIPDPADYPVHLATRSDRYGRFGDHHGIFVDCLADLLGRGIHVGQVGMAGASACQQR